MCVKDYGGWTLQLLVCREPSGGSVLNKYINNYFRINYYK